MQKPASSGHHGAGAAMGAGGVQPGPNKAKSDPSTSGEIGKPLLDEKAIEDSPMFDKPPVSIEEGMAKLDKGHRRRRALVAVIAAALVLIAGVGTYFVLKDQGIIQGSIAGSASDLSIIHGTSSLTSSSSSSSAGGKAASGANSASSSTSTDSNVSGMGDQSGSVIYQYTAKTSNGTQYTVQETVTFQYNGDCGLTTMDMMFPSEQDAKSFTDSLARDYGSGFKLDSLNGANAIVTIDNSGLHLTREEYENALRYSVSDLVVVKK